MWGSMCALDFANIKGESDLMCYFFQECLHIKRILKVRITQFELIPRMFIKHLYCVDHIGGTMDKKMKDPCAQTSGRVT